MSPGVPTRMELSAEERAFVDLLAQGMPPGDAAEHAGFPRKMAREVGDRPAVVAAMYADTQFHLRRGALSAGFYLADVSSGLQDGKASRIDASKAVLDRSGHNVPAARPASRLADADLSEYSIDELKQIVAKGERVLGDRAKPVNATLDATPDPMLLNLLD